MTAPPLLAAIGSSSQVLWYVARGTGLIDLVLLSLTFVLGVGQLTRRVPSGWPRFVVGALHRNAALLSLVFLALHVATIELDTYVHVGLWSVVVPFVSGYHPLTLGLGTVALDLMVAVVGTSLLRERVGYRTWRAVHWTAYAVWPLAVAHGLAIGTDSGEVWVWVLNGLCIAPVVVVTGWRLARLRAGGPAALDPPRRDVPGETGRLSPQAAPPPAAPPPPAAHPPVAVPSEPAP